MAVADRAQVRVGAAAVDSRVTAILNRHPAVGLAVGIVRDGRLDHFSGHGFADVASRTPVTQDTFFRIGSITKTFTAIAVMQLAEEGLIDLDGTANDYLRAYKLVPSDPRFRPATVRHLLTHTAGIREVLHLSTGFYLLDEFVKAGRRVPSLAEYYRGGLPVQTDPGTRFRYTDHGFATLGQIVEDLTGTSLELYLRERVFGPLGMTETTLVRSDLVRSRLATGYTLGRRGLRVVPDYDVLTTGAGAAYSTTRDLALFAAALLDRGANRHGSVLRPDTVATMFAPHHQPDPRLPGEGLVFSRTELGEHEVVWHGGILEGFTSQLWAAPADGVAVLAFTNGSRLPHLWLPSEAGRLLGELLGVEDTVRSDVAQHPEVWAGLLGFYQLPARLTDVRARAMVGAGVEVFIRGGRLMARILTPIPGAYAGFELHPDDERDPYVFRVDLSRFGLPTGRVVFTQDANGAATRISSDLHPIALEKRSALHNPRLWGQLGLGALGVAAVSRSVAGRRQRRGTSGP